MRPARLDNLILDALDPEAIAPFWCALLGVEVVDRISGGQFVELGRPPAGGVPLIIQRVPEAKFAKNRMHVDLEVEDLEEATAEIERLGGRWTDDHTYGEAGYVWRIMADPECNEFCIFPARPDAS